MNHTDSRLNDKRIICSAVGSLITLHDSSVLLGYQTFALYGRPLHHASPRSESESDDTSSSHCFLLLLDAAFRTRLTLVLKCHSFPKKME